ncbi:MAG: hypothetical protein IPI67_24425 [Myxococcales bacterium]|nr:hypothetical protein [Myxococcales bacterium]
MLAKLGAQGNPVWAKRFGGSGDDRALGVASDASGNVLMSGIFSGSIDFGGGPLVSAVSWDVFLTKLSATGQHVFSKRFGDASQHEARTLAVAPNGDIVIAGSFTGTLDFGGGPLVSTGANDIYVAALSSAGSQLFSKRFGSAASDGVAALAVGPSGDIYAAGMFDGTIDFGTGLHTSAGAGDILVKLSATGSTAWSRSYGLNNNWESVGGITADAAGVTLAGTFWGSQSFGGPAVVSKGGTDTFVAKLDPSGNHLWSRSFGGTGSDPCWGFAGNPDGSTAVVVRFNAPVDVGGTVFAPSPDSWLVSKLTSAGAIAWTQAYGAASPTFARGGASGRFAVVGTFSSALDFGGTPLSGGAFDVFVVTFAP